MSGPFVIGARVQLRAFEEEDAPLLAAWINDPEVRRFLMMRFPKSVRDEREWLAAMAAQGPSPRNLVLGVELRKDCRLIGSIGLHGIDWVMRRAMTGIFICPPAMRGRGYGTEAKNLMLDYAFGELGMHSLWALAFADNAASIAALEKQGYRRNGVMREAVRLAGRWADCLYYDILCEDWGRLRGIAPARAKKPRRKTGGDR